MIKEKHLVVTTEKWRTMARQNNEIKRMKRLADIDCTIHTDWRYGLKPEVKNGRITREWFEENISREAKAQGYTHAKFVFSMSEGKRWGVDSGIRGSNYRDKDFFGESWIRTNEKSRVRYRRGPSRKRYVKVFLHEDGHEYYNQGFTRLKIHDYDYRSDINNIEGFYKQLQFSHAQQQFVLWQRIKDLAGMLLPMISKEQLVTPLIDKYWNNVTQPYGVENSMYTQTGRHIGVDLGCPVGIPVRARKDGSIVETGKTDALGMYCIFQYVLNGEVYEERYLHLSEIRPNGSYMKGDTIAKTGNSGMSTGPHLHVDTWYDEVNIAIINKSNWDEITVDPKKI